ncbi:MAG: branched-chain amino acid ABC transporter permease [Deltaproteobacteria bacterium]|jgi:branched-chain amino acid transport system permease protein|nr:branched-chain amino acid ABC transporter permease [Deltaproteobacteria bacterium]
MGLRTGTFHENYAEDMAVFQTRLQWGASAALVFLLCICPLFSSDRMLTILTTIGIAVISVHGLNILTGYCGQISIGHSGFMAVGGYTSAILCAKLGWPFWAALPCGAVAAGIAGLLFGLPSLKIKGFYLIMATIAAQFIIIWFIIQLRGITGGTDGLLVPKPMLGPIALSSKTNYYYLVMIFAALATITAHNIVRTRAGRAFIAIRDNDLAAEVMGVSLWSYKLQAFFIGCIYAGAAGSLLIHYVRFASIEQFPFMDSVWYLGMLIVGGMGNTAGAIFGVIALKLLDELVTIIGPVLAAAVAPQAAASLALISHGLIIIIFLIFEPRGLHHRWEMIKNYFRLWPFSHEALE